jgi:hypothetical protein
VTYFGIHPFFNGIEVAGVQKLLYPKAKPGVVINGGIRLGVVVGALPAGSVASCNRQSSEPDVVHDHVRLCQDQVVAVASISIRVGPPHMKRLGTTEGGESMGHSSCGCQLGSGGGSSEMISNGCPYANGKVLIEGVGEHLLPTAQAWGLGGRALR